MKTIKDLLSSEDKKNIYIAGGGQYGKTVAIYLKKRGLEYIGVVDKKEKEFLGTTTITYDKADIEGNYIIASLKYDYENQIREALLSRGVRMENIYVIDTLEIVEELFDVVYDYSEKYAPGIREYKNKYKGETCFIIGNGPSLRAEDLDKLVGKHCFAANGIYKMYPFTAWRPEFYFAQDAEVTQKILMEDIGKVVESVIFTSINSPLLGFEKKYENIRYTRLYYEEDNGMPKFSSECDKVLNISRTVTYSMLQMAAYMGFETIYLLGIDCAYRDERLEDGTIICNENLMNYNEEIEKLNSKWKEKMDVVPGAYVYQMIKGFKVAKKYAENNNIQIYNATRGGKLEVFERVDFDSLF